MTTISIPVDITPPPADDELVEPRERRVAFAPVQAAKAAIFAAHYNAGDARLRPLFDAALTPERIAA